MKSLNNNAVFLGILVTLSFLFLTACSNKRKGNPRILVFSKTTGFVHSSIPNGIAAIQKLGAENGFEVDTTKDATAFNQENLDKYAAVVFLNTTGDVLDFEQEIAFERYIQAGGGFAGVHAATDTEYGWNWYGKLVGAYFKSHPAIQEATFSIEDHSCAACNPFVEAEKEWIRTDELYNFKNLNDDVNVILSIDESSYDGGENGDNHPMSWYHEFEGGRAFYTALGHTEESYEEEKYLAHLLSGIQYAMGENLNLNYSKATTQLSPDGSRFTKNVLVGGEFYEPTEMAILPNLDILIAQRRGELLRFDYETEELKEVAKLDVYHHSGVDGVNAEEGFMGLQKDPNFAENNWIYTFYSPKGEEWVNRLSRFKFIDDSLHLESEQIILDVPSQRQICCHTGGSIAFGPDNILYLSTGDNSTPFDEPDADYVNEGFAPLNDLPNKKQYDARRSSGNTNDLRGKIIRIKVNEDGSYDIPEGNLFPKGTPKTRPEIFTMGHRNPYRISVDPKHGWVYWGDVGPDARDDKWDTRGPRGYDELNQAREAGNYGWPLFIADNKPYRAYNYATGESGELFDPQKPINNSKNNTGLENLPPAQPANIYYHYGNSEIWPGVASGGRNAMAGPTYYKDLYEGSESLPDYYDGKVLIYDWMRGWMKAVSLFENGTFRRVEPFAPNIKLNNLIDMELGPDGNLYLLEYGTGWFAKNADSGLSYVKFNDGNQPPTIENLIVDKLSGTAPLTINAQVEANDLEKGKMTYLWSFGDSVTIETNEPQATYTFEEPGAYSVAVKVRDDQSMTARSKTVPVISGNEKPQVDIEIEGGNTSFFMPGMPIKYKVTVNDKEDSVEGIDESKIYVTADFMEGFDEASLSMGHQEISPIAAGEALANSLTCKSCHKKAEKSNGPSFVEIAEKYADEGNAISHIQRSIINGSVGVWGDTNMPANPNMEPAEANQIAQFIMSLSGKVSEKKNSLPSAGIYMPKAPVSDNPLANHTLVFTASYTDKGAPNTIPLTGIKRLAFKSNAVSMTDATDLNEFTGVAFGGQDLLIMPKKGGHFALPDIDLSGVKKLEVTLGWQSAPSVGIELSVYKDAPNGTLLGKGKMITPKEGAQFSVLPITLDQTINEKVDKLYFVYQPEEKDRMGMLTFVVVVSVEFSAGTLQ